MSENDVELLRFQPHDQYIADAILAALRDLQRRELSAHQLYCLALAIRCVERWPRATPEVVLEITLTNRVGKDDYGYYALALWSDEIRLSWGECLYGAYGSDHSSFDILTVGTGWYELRDVNETEIYDWLEEFQCRASDPDIKVSFEDNTEPPIEWEDDEDEQPANYWHQLAEEQYE